MNVIKLKRVNLEQSWRGVGHDTNGFSERDAQMYLVDGKYVLVLPLEWEPGKDEPVVYPRESCAIVPDDEWVGRVMNEVSGVEQMKLSNQQGKHRRG